MYKKTAIDEPVSRFLIDPIFEAKCAKKIAKYEPVSRFLIDPIFEATYEKPANIIFFYLCIHDFQL